MKNQTVFRPIPVLTKRMFRTNRGRNLVAVLAILITAPLGALGMDATYRKLLQKNGENNII